MAVTLLLGNRSGARDDPEVRPRDPGRWPRTSCAAGPA